MSVQDCGTNSQGLLPIFSLDGSSSKTSPDSCEMESVTFLKTWPECGSMHNGQLFQQPPLVPHINGSDYGLLPTPTASDWKGSCKHGQRRGTLAEYIETMPAWLPCECCEEFLCTICGDHAWNCPCPPVEEWQSGPYDEVQHGRLNPQFVEWMQGFPIGWTDLKDLETP